MVDLETVQDKLIRLTNCDLSKDFIAIAIQLNDNNIDHCGIIICYEETITFFHFDGTVKIETLDTPPTNIFLKEIETVVEENINGFKAYCEILADEVHPQYGFVFDNSFYSIDGNLYLNNGKVDIVTCVGFCIKVIRGYLINNPEYLALDDWDISSLDDFMTSYSDYIYRQISNIQRDFPDQYNDIISKNYKRVTPFELTCSAFFFNLPIRKTSIDQIHPTVENILEMHRLVG